MPLIKAGPHLPLPAVNKTPLMALCPGWGGGRPGNIPTQVQMRENKLSLISDTGALSPCNFVLERLHMLREPTLPGQRGSLRQVSAALPCPALFVGGSSAVSGGRCPQSPSVTSHWHTGSVCTSFITCLDAGMALLYILTMTSC